MGFKPIRLERRTSAASKAVGLDYGYDTVENEVFLSLGEPQEWQNECRAYGARDHPHPISQPFRAGLTFSVGPTDLDERLSPSSQGFQ